MQKVFGWAVLACVLCCVGAALSLAMTHPPEPIWRVFGSGTPAAQGARTVETVLGSGDFVSDAPDGQAFAAVEFMRPHALALIEHAYTSVVSPQYQVASAAVEWSDDGGTWTEAARGDAAAGALALRVDAGAHPLWRLLVLRSGEDPLVIIGKVTFVRPSPWPSVSLAGAIACLTLAGALFLLWLVVQTGIQPGERALSFRRFVMEIAAFTAALILLGTGGAAAFVRSDWYPRFSSYRYDTLVDQRMRLTGQKNDVVVIGDSSALVGIDPRLVEKELPGMSVYNLSLHASSGIEGVRIVLDHYLANNATPKLVLFQINPMHPNENESKERYDRASVIFRYGSWREIAAHFLARPDDLQSLNGRFRVYLREMLESPVYSSAFLEFAKRRGSQGPYATPPSAACADPTPLTTSPTSYITDLRDHLRSLGIPMILNVAPMRDCDSSTAYYAQFYRNIAASGPQKLPSSYFSDYTHLTEEGSKLYAPIIAGVIRRALN
jgi:hypothetical protein